MTGTTIISTHIRSESDHFDIRREFCGFQDKNLNELRQFTSCIIDVQTHGIKDPFEKVTWVITHYDPAVRAFVVKRIQAWSQMTQIAAQMHMEDTAFRQQMLSDVSPHSMDIKVKQLVGSIKSSSSPPASSVPLLTGISKTPSHEYHFGSVPNAALVPQTDIQPRHQQRRRRNSSSSSSGTRRPALFGKPSDHFFQRPSEYPRSRFSPIAKTRTNETVTLLNETGLSLIKPSVNKEHSADPIGNQSKESDSGNEYDDVDFEEEAKWANLLSDTSDFEDDSHPLMADIILVAQLRDRLVNSNILPTDNVKCIQALFTAPLSITGHEQLKTLNNESIWFYRLVLNSKIILSDGVHKSRRQAQKMAYAKMVRLMINEQGVEPKIIANGRCKVVLRKCLSPKQVGNNGFNETTMIDSMMNSINCGY